MKKPDVIIETGTYKGGLTFFFVPWMGINPFLFLWLIGGGPHGEMHWNAMFETPKCLIIFLSK